jgi:pimeloyl-ACP methyl ester carboxylesterase
MQDNRVGVDGTSGAAQVTPVSLTATTADGVTLAGVHLFRREPAHGTALVVAHGFTHHTRHPATRKLLGALATEVPVVAFDMRGHGRSGGRNTVGDREPLDLDAAVATARGIGYERVATAGFSLGAAVALRHAAQGTHRPDAVVAVSSPARWYSRETAAMRRVHWLLEQPHGRLAARALGVRLDGGWEVVPPSPVEVVAGIAAPLLLVHIAGDRYFSAAHARALAAASGGRAELWTEPGDGHGESGTHPALARRIARWAVLNLSRPQATRKGCS